VASSTVGGMCAAQWGSATALANKGQAASEVLRRVLYGAGIRASHLTATALQSDGEFAD
jgi:hypothetical protein